MIQSMELKDTTTERPFTHLDALDSTAIGENEPTRVALVVSTFEMGGLERCAASLINHLDRSRYTPTLVSLSRVGGAASWISVDDLEVVELNKRPGNDPSVVWKLARTLRERGIDVVHSHNWGTLVETTLARRWAGVPVHVHAEHGLELSDLELRRWKFVLRRTAMRWALNRASAVVVVAESVREKLVQRSGISAKKIKVVPNGVELPGLEDADRRARDIRASLRLEDGEWLLGSVGRLAPVKNFCMAIDALALLRQRGVRAHLAIVGDGPDQDKLQTYAREHGVADCIHLAGQQEDVAAWYAAIDVYLNSSLSEGMNLAIIEAMAAGVPTVVTDVGASRMMVDTEPANGLVVPSGDASQLAAATGQLLDNKTQRDHMSNCGRLKFRNEYGVAAMTHRYTELYRQYVRDRRTRKGDRA